MGVWGHRSESGGTYGGLGLHIEGLGAPKVGIRGTYGGLGAHMGVWGDT